jgi:hypothetical protein
MPALVQNPKPPYTRPMSSQDRRPPQRPWVMIFILLSLLAHLLFVLAIIVISHFIPAPKLKQTPDQLSSVSLSLEQPPAPPIAAQPPPPKHIFMPTKPDAQAKHKETLVESDNDSRLRSQSQKSRDPNSIVPDVNVKQKHAANLHDSPNAPSKNKPTPAETTAEAQSKQPNTAPPSPQAPPQQNPLTAQAPKITPNPQPNAKVTQETPAKSTSPQPTKQDLDPNGLPVLPPLDAPTMAPRTQHEDATTASSIPEVAQDTHGAVGTHGDDSPEAMATELGRYKAKVYRTVGALWYHKVDQQLQVLPVGVVHIQFTVYKDGTVDTKVLEGDSGALQLLLAVSLNSIRESAPFDPFTDSMIKQVGDSYTDDFTFSIYGGGN